MIRATAAVANSLLVLSSVLMSPRGCGWLAVTLGTRVCAFTDDYWEPAPDEGIFQWGLPMVLERNQPAGRDPRLQNCIENVLPGDPGLCHPGAHRRISVDTKDPSEAVPPWDAEVRKHAATLKHEVASIPLDYFVPYCHHHDDCPNPSWRIMPLMVLGLKVPHNLRVAPHAAKLLTFMVSSLIDGACFANGRAAAAVHCPHAFGPSFRAALQEKNIPGLITVALSLSAAHGHITPHCGALEGFQFVRHHLAIKVPEPRARFRICGRVYEFEEGQLMGFNNSIPHEVINPSSDARVVLLFDVLLPDILRSDKGHRETMAYLTGKWGATLRDLRLMNNMTEDQYAAFAASKVHRHLQGLEVKDAQGRTKQPW